MKDWRDFTLRSARAANDATNADIAVNVSRLPRLHLPPRLVRHGRQQACCPRLATLDDKRNYTKTLRVGVTLTSISFNCLLRQAELDAGALDYPTLRSWLALHSSAEYSVG